MSYIANLTVENGNLVINGSTVTIPDESGIPDEIGQHKRGGIIYYIFQPNETEYVEGEVHGLVATEKDLPYTYSFGFSEYSGNTTPSTSIGSGSGNTATIVSEIAAVYPDFKSAARAARACRDGGYDDWFLPSLDEMNMMCPPLWDGYLETLYTAPESSGVQKPYWTSSSYAEGGCWGYLFFSDIVKEADWNNGNPGWYGWGGSTVPTELRLVRPIRKF